MTRQGSGAAKSSTRRKHPLRRNIILLALIIMSGTYAVLDYVGPGVIRLKSGQAFGMSCLRARGLIVQENDQNGNLWATRGMIVYKLKKGDDRFTRVAHIPTGPSIFWLRNFSILRRLTLRPECVEMVVTSRGDICALSAGTIWYKQADKKGFRQTMQLSHYGLGDQGLRNDGIVCVNDSVIYLGEYFQNPEKTKVTIFVSTNYGKSWRVAYEFLPGEIRHIHAVQKDAYAGKLWICTGDRDEESMVAFSEDDFKTLQSIGKGSQLWRVCQLVFTEDAVYWGTDTGDKEIAGIYRWDRTSTELTKLQVTDGAMFFATRLAGGTIVMSTDREGMHNESDDRTRIWLITPSNKTGSIVCGTWKHKKPGFRYKFAMLRFQRDQGSNMLSVTCLNQKEFPDGELLIFPENELINAAKFLSQE